MDKDEFKVLRQENEQILSVVNRIDRDLDGATKDSQELTLRMGAIEGEVRQLKEMIAKMPVKVADKVDSVMQPAVELKEAIDAKKSFKIELKRRWWEIWK